MSSMKLKFRHCGGLEGSRAAGVCDLNEIEPADIEKDKYSTPEITNQDYTEFSFYNFFLRSLLSNINCKKVMK